MDPNEPTVPPPPMQWAASQRCNLTQSPVPGHTCVCVKPKDHDADGETPWAWHMCTICKSQWSDERVLDATDEGDRTAQIIRIPTDVAWTRPGQGQQPDNPAVPDLTPYAGDLQLIMQDPTCDCDDYPDTHPSHRIIAVMVRVARDFHLKGRSGQAL